ncbi:myrcene synthase [Quercus suber]|uniref:Myrcene synthase n=1 Tax=Quercus suber TaxID=58331 RepID=A0AAW0LR08_QUESU
MAHTLLSSLPIRNFARVPVPCKDPFSLVTPRSGTVPFSVQCMHASKISSSPEISRRSANYQPPIWQYDYIQSLRSEYVEESCTRQVNVLVEQVRMMLHKVGDPLVQLELIDVLQRLGLSYHFEAELKRILEALYSNDHGGDTDTWKMKNLYATALKFRLLRQHGYSVSQDVFNSFKDERGKFKACLCEDTKGMLSLYEASFLSIEGENILDEVRDFSTKHLEEYVKQNKDKNFATIISHSLELPLHWRMLRSEARWFIDIYRSKQDMNPILLELAELNFNIVQAAHQEDLKQVSRWWKSTGLAENLSFARDRLMENFLWTVGVIFQPQFGYCRRMLTKVNALITTIDDVYDVYGTLDELELFTGAVERWDINAIDELPDYMKLCFIALHNSINEMAFDTLKEQGFHVIRYFKKAWADLCRSYLLEAKWYNSGYKPSLQEYIENAWISISAPTILDELKRGDVPKSIQCYMNETGASEEEAREHIRFLISATWKKMNEDRAASSPFSETFIEIALNLARMAQCMYQHGDGHGAGNHETKDRVFSLLIQPIPPYKDQ